MQISSIQTLRALAALSVVIGHAQAFIGLPMEKLGQTFTWSYLLPWGAGVDLFFVISGFIMVYASEKLFAAQGGAKIFLWRRLTRIAPLYWCATLLLLVKNAIQHKPPAEFPAIVASFLFIPFDSAGTGIPRPVYELGWTLNYEMFFYLVFALCLFARREMAVTLAALALAVLVLLGAAFPAANPLWQVWTQPIILEFVLGMALSLAVRRQFVLPGIWRFSLVLLGTAAIFHDFLQSQSQPHVWVTPNDLTRVAAWGIPAAMIMAGCVLKAARVTRENYLLAAGKHLGDASYALYLFHPLVLGAFSALWFALGVNKWLPAGVGVAASVVLSVGVSLLVYRWFERPVTQFLQRGSGARSLGPSAAAVAGER